MVGESKGCVLNFPWKLPSTYSRQCLDREFIIMGKAHLVALSTKSVCLYGLFDLFTSGLSGNTCLWCVFVCVF